MTPDPFADMRRIQSEVNRLFQQAGHGSPRAGGYPAVNVYASQDGVAITAELPGVAESDLDITVHRDTLTLKGERRPQVEDAKGYHRRERGRGAFVRTLQLPFPVDPEKVDASYENGVLRMSLHRPEDDKPKKIKIKAS